MIEGQPTIGIIDDNKAMCKIISIMLDRLGYTSYWFENDPEEGTNKATSFETNVLILDGILPGIDGIEVYEYIRSCELSYGWKPMKIILTTVFEEELREDLKEVLQKDQNLTLLGMPFFMNDLKLLLEL